MNFKEGRGILPSSQTENLIEQIRLSKMDPNHNYTMAQVMKGIGDVKQPVVNQVVQGGFNVINPEITGDIKQLPHVSERHRWEVKTENKRRDTQALEYIYDWRNNTPLNNEGKVQPGYYQNKLNASAKSKIRMSNTADAMRVQYPGPDSSIAGMGEYIPEGLNGIAGLATTKPEKFEMSATRGANTTNMQEGTLSFSDLGLSGNHSQIKLGPQFERIDTYKDSDIPVEVPSYNPFLNGSSGNISKYQESYPDERQTQYSGERNYMTKGDRIMAAVELAKSQRNIERRQLQEQANHALNGTVRSARTIGSEFGRGINVGATYNNPEYEQPDIQQAINPNNRQKVEHFVDRSHDLNRQQNIQQNVQVYYGPGLEQIKHEVADNEIQRKLYDNDEGDKPGLFHAFIEGFKCLFWSDDSTKEIHDRRDFQNYNDLEIRQIFKSEGAEWLLNDPIIHDEVIKIITQRRLTKEQGKRDGIIDSEFIESLLHVPIIQNRLKELEQRRKDLNKLYFMKHGVKTEFNPETMSISQITEPISVLSLDGQTVIRTMLCRNDNGHGGMDYKILQIRKPVDNSTDFEYVLSSIGIDEVDHILRKSTNEDVRWTGDIAELTFEDHIHLNQAIDEGSIMSISSSKPLHPYQRDILDNNESLAKNCFSNILQDLNIQDLDKKEKQIQKSKYHGININSDGELNDDTPIQYTTQRNEKYENEGSRLNLGTRKVCDMKTHMKKLNEQM